MVGVVGLANYCTCEYQRRSFYSLGGEVPATPAQQKCLDDVSRFLKSFSRGGNYYPDCLSKTYIGTLPSPQPGHEHEGLPIDPSGSAITWSNCLGSYRKCSPRTLMKQGHATCATCESYITLMSTFIHECRHQNYDCISTTPEHDAATYTRDFLSDWQDQVCKQLVANNVCGNEHACRRGFAKNIANENKLANSHPNS